MSTLATLSCQSHPHDRSHVVISTLSTLSRQSHPLGRSHVLATISRPSHPLDRSLKVISTLATLSRQSHPLDRSHKRTSLAIGESVIHPETMRVVRLGLRGLRKIFQKLRDFRRSGPPHVNTSTKKMCFVNTCVLVVEN